MIFFKKCFKDIISGQRHRNYSVCVKVYINDKPHVGTVVSARYRMKKINK